jgi:hypothetical protein
MPDFINGCTRGAPVLLAGTGTLIPARADPGGVTRAGGVR